MLFSFGVGLQFSGSVTKPNCPNKHRTIVSMVHISPELYSYLQNNHADNYKGIIQSCWTSTSTYTVKIGTV